MERKPSKVLNYAFWLALIVGLGYFKLNFHELWKDEWQAWFVARDKNVFEIFSFLYYEGHPGLWYFFLKPFTYFSNGANDVFLISLAHWFTVAAGLYFLFIKFRLPILFKILFACGYFLGFEYGLINRGYFLVILFAFWAAWLVSENNCNKKHLSWVLFLLCQTEVYGTMMALVFGGYLYLEKPKDTIATLLKSTEIKGLLAGLFFFIISVFPRSAGHVAKTSSKDWDFIDKVLVSFQGNLSNTFLPGSTFDTFTYGWTALGLYLSIILLAAMIYIFKDHKNLLYAASTFIGGMMLFSLLFFMGGIRQWGMGFIFFVALLQIRNLNLLQEKIVSVILLCISITGVIHGFKAFREDIRIPFTNAKEVGAFIEAKVPLKVPVVAINKFECTPVVGYAKRKFYELPNGVEFSYFRWVDRIYMPSEGELKLFTKYKGVGGIVILTPKMLDAQRYPNAQLWQKFDQKNYKNENYYLYSLPLK
jgi:hypothetical protein